MDQYPYVAMDTEFPGVVVRSVGNFQRAGQFQYATLRHNVNMLKLIQARGGAGAQRVGSRLERPVLASRRPRPRRRSWD